MIVIVTIVIKKMRRKIGLMCGQSDFFSRERRNQVEPRCAERWHLCDDEQFDLAAWFPSLS